MRTSKLRMSSMKYQQIQKRIQKTKNDIVSEETESFDLKQVKSTYRLGDVFPQLAELKKTLK